jgi:hypothetical protein
LPAIVFLDIEPKGIAMAQRTGVPALMLVARRMCNLITKFTPILTQLYGTNSAFMTALSAANAACMALHEELAQVRVYGD